PKLRLVFAGRPAPPYRPSRSQPHRCPPGAKNPDCTSWADLLLYRSLVGGEFGFGKESVNNARSTFLLSSPSRAAATHHWCRSCHRLFRCVVVGSPGC